MLGFLITIIISLITAFVGDAIAKGKMPGGRWVTLLIAVLGAWIGGYMLVFKGVGPSINKLNVIPSIIGSALFVLIYGLFRKVISQVKI